MLYHSSFQKYPDIVTLSLAKLNFSAQWLVSIKVVVLQIAFLVLLLVDDFMKDIGGCILYAGNTDVAIPSEASLMFFLVGKPMDLLVSDVSGKAWLLPERVQGCCLARGSPFLNKETHCLYKLVTDFSVLLQESNG